MTQSKQKVKELSDKLMQVNPSQIVIDLVQEGVDELLYEYDGVTPDDIGSLIYQFSILKEVYNPELNDDLRYITDLMESLRDWESDVTFANKSLGLDPNK